MASRRPRSGYVARVRPGDADLDDDMDAADAAAALKCLHGPDVSAVYECRSHDLDLDRDVDLRDLARVQTPLGTP